MDKKFVTAINCMDGRAQGPILEYMTVNFGADYVDMITEPGPNKILSDCTDVNLVESVKKRVEISVHKHKSEYIAIVGHHDCAGNPVGEDIQKEHLRKAVEVVSSWGFPVKQIIALWLDEDFKPSVINS